LAGVAEEVKKLPEQPQLAAILVTPERPECFEVEPPNIPKNPEVQPRDSLEVEPLSGSLSGLRKFLELKKKAAEKVGIDFRVYEFPADITTQKLRKEVVKIAKAGVNHGVLVELPLPAHINTQYVLNSIPTEKDVDVLSEKSQGAFFVNRSEILPPAVEAVKQIFKHFDISIPSKACAVFGYGLLIGKPIAHWLAQQGATVSIINEFTPAPVASRQSLAADIIITGVGKPNLVTANMVKEGVVAIDFGFSVQLEARNQKLETGKMVGDISFDEVVPKASLITPVPGGIGPIVIAAVLKNLATLMKTRKK